MSPMTEMLTTKLTIPPDVPMVSITGIADELLRLIQDSFSAKVSLQGSEISITGSEADREALVTLFSEMVAAIQSGQTLDSAAVRNLMGLTRSAHLSPSLLRQDVILAHKGRVIRPKTEGQKRYVDAVRDHDITFAVGCAGTGKSARRWTASSSLVPSWKRGRTWASCQAPSRRRWTPTSVPSTMPSSP